MQGCQEPYRFWHHENACGIGGLGGIGGVCVASKTGEMGPLEQVGKVKVDVLKQQKWLFLPCWRLKCQVSMSAGLAPAGGSRGGSGGISWLSCPPTSLLSIPLLIHPSPGCLSFVCAHMCVYAHMCVSQTSMSPSFLSSPYYLFIYF